MTKLRYIFLCIANVLLMTKQKLQVPGRGPGGLRGAGQGRLIMIIMITMILLLVVVVVVVVAVLGVVVVVVVVVVLVLEALVLILVALVSVLVLSSAILGFVCYLYLLYPLRWARAKANPTAWRGSRMARGGQTCHFR